ncbi:MAG: hypothetical protein UU73_C0004G0018 [Candidatus Daviesbacteria bacterium GW2011_GWA1_41_61]|uniref:Uncharacterized protein n=1 Tax=Candidatus Daviesbacteria bacterium GW2011_GWA2_40_9 TaxID=1618424 RepID=A0A0G0X6S5_9BACT|nr:MAG: hypothetical protein UU26_C0011G0017 [Candidatus Daviesbacteria bacterium GW2011_GWC1_40_9]KKR83347.1 MAG: hypothetical protein UU29_C0006G0036 [Candidatus Daviesbacteria bacterium GW2011_GWA2_40_9]KKR93222.1 MAG: hypothetical protein UU44_C0003G0018 [Candidatus Daviesbacteria bacterium GW2011_GWB1_41_15]KKS14710.1 MAG: hypothetical protein UU73_C0004G0018 [Candidatus Daviesbacteria bacterium GW2011_GWA1_41_61]
MIAQAQALRLQSRIESTFNVCLLLSNFRCSILIAPDIYD